MNEPLSGLSFIVATVGVEPQTFHKVPSCAVAYTLNLFGYYGFDLFRIENVCGFHTLTINYLLYYVKCKKTAL